MASRQPDDFQVIQLLQRILQNSDLTKLTRKQLRKQLEDELDASFSSPQWKARIKQEIEQFVLKRDQQGINTHSISISTVKQQQQQQTLSTDSYSEYDSTNIIIEKGEIISHFIYPTSIDEYEVNIKLSLHEPAQTKQYFYIYQVGMEENEYLDCITVQKGEKESNVGGILMESLDFNDDSFVTIALYESPNDKKVISGSNVLPIDDYLAQNWDDVPSILSSTIRAIQSDDENDENIYLYFDFPFNLKGEYIGFDIVYDDDDNNKKEEEISLPLVLNKEWIGKSFQIITKSSIPFDCELEYRSVPSDRIQIISTDSYSKCSKQSTNIIIEKGEIISHFIYPTFIGDREIHIKLSLYEPAQTKKDFYIHQVGMEENECYCCMTVQKGEKESESDWSRYSVENEITNIALYENENDKEPIPGSNILEIPSYEYLIDYYDYDAPPILSSTIQAIQTEDEKDENIYVYFDFPLNLKGYDIGFKIFYDDNNNNKDAVDISLPLVLNKEWIGKPFQIITNAKNICPLFGCEEYQSAASGRIQIIYSASMQSNDAETEKENKEIEGWENRYNELKSSHHILKEDKNNLHEKIVELNEKMNKMSLEMNGLRKEHQNEDLRDKLDEDDKKKDDEIFKIRFDEWLNNTVKLKQYLSIFVESECNDVRMIEFFEDELIEKEIGIKNIFHRKLIIKEAKQFKKSQNEFDHLLDNNKKLKPFKEILTINGILRLQDFKKYIKNKQQFAKMLNIINDDKINQIWTIFNVNDYV